MKYLINIVAISLFLLLISCNSKNGKENIKTSLETGKSKLSNNGKVQTVDRDTLKRFLPTAIPGTDKMPSKSGSIFQANVVITTCSAEYEFSNKGFLDCSITDYGKLDNIPEFDRKRFNDPPQNSGMTTTEVILPSGKGYVVWDNSQKNGSFNALILNRFIIKIDAYRLPKSILNLQDYVKFIKINELVNYIDKNK